MLPTLVVLLLAAGRLVMPLTAQAAPLARPPVEKQQAAGAVRRLLKFPDSYTVGTLYLVPDKDGSGRTAMSKSMFCGSAKGERTLTVPPGRIVLLALNVQTIEKPARIEQI